MRLPLAVVCLLALCGCETLAYYQQSIQGHFALMAGRRPIADMLREPGVDEGLKTRLRAVQEIRRFASDALDLPDNDSYRSYTDVGRDVLLWNLVAAPALSLQPRQWCYPVIGCASYRGYFERSAADAHAERLRAEGLDVAVLPVPAYSSLGWFDDPVPSTVDDWPLADLAGLIFHELAHQRVYARNDSAFNESYATVVEEFGVERWLAATGEPAAAAAWRRRQAARQTFLELVKAARAQLDNIYAARDDDSERLLAKSRVLDGLREDFNRRVVSDDALARYRRWFAQDLNNAHLASVDTYRRWVDALRILLRRLGNDPAAFHAASARLAAEDVEQRQQSLCELLGERAVGQPDRRSDMRRFCRPESPK